MSGAGDVRAYPDRPFLAVSAAIIREGRILLVRRARRPALGLYTFPGGVVEAGETLLEALLREVREETALEIEPIALAGHREIIVRGEDGRLARHFVVLAFAAHWQRGETALSAELAEAHWVEPDAIASFAVTEGLGGIAQAALALAKRG